METIITQPSAAPVIQSLRNIGYNAPTAIADIVDNSIDANTTFVKMNFEYNDKNCFIIIEDDGIGMSEEELQIAMTIGSKDPREERKKNELGRFGMGLKTASFSLGKRLSVISKKEGAYVERCWDLDYVSQRNEWHLFSSIPEEIRNKIGQIEGESGTIVFIDKLDRFCGDGTLKKISSRVFYNKVKKIQDYLEMVFHEKLEQGLELYINNNFLFPWDPFLRSHPSTTVGETQIIRVNNKRIRVTPYVLPHPSDFNDQEYKAAGGVKGWRDQQGFYIYREGRLVNFGEWFGLFKKDTQYELVRIKVEFNNDADDDWKVDIKKSSISLPEDAKENLKGIAKYYRQVSKEIMLYRVKGNKHTNRIKTSLHTWELDNDEKDSAYVLNRNHPLLLEILKEITDEQRKKLNTFLKFVEIGSPMNFLQPENLIKKDELVQEVDDSLKSMILILAKSIIPPNGSVEIEDIINEISLFPGFESIKRETFKHIIEEGELIHG